MAVTFPAGTKPPYVLSGREGGAHVVDTCKDSTKPTAQTVAFSTCLAGLGYSSAFTFATDRVIVK